MNLQEEIKSLKAHIALIEKQIADEKKQEEFNFERVEKDKPYYYVYLFDGFGVSEATEDCVSFDDNMFASNNYFHSEERAEEVAEKIKMLLKLERLHDTLCPDYVPDWKDDSFKYYVFWSHTDHRWDFNCNVSSERATDVYFPTRQVAHAVCDILNAEKEAK